MIPFGNSGSPADRLSNFNTGNPIVHGLVLVTRNVKDAAWTGVSCLNPFESGGQPPRAQ